MAGQRSATKLGGNPARKPRATTPSGVAWRSTRVCCSGRVNAGWSRAGAAFSSAGIFYILMVMDYFTKWPEAFVVPN